MKIAFVIYDSITLLDFAGVNDPLTRLKSMGFLDNLQWDVCAPKETVCSSEGAELVPDRVNTNLTEYDYVINPGGDGIKDLMQNKTFLCWITNHSDTPIVAAVCGGSLLLGAAGMLRTGDITSEPDGSAAALCTGGCARPYRGRGDSHHGRWSDLGNRSRALSL